MKQRLKKLRQRFKKRPRQRPIERPNPLPWFYRWRTNLIQAPLFVLLTALCGSISLLISFVDKKGNAQHRIARFWARASVWNSYSKLKVIGAENLRKHPVAVYTSNHTSYMDVPVLFAALPFQFRIIAWKALWPIPFIGWYLNRSGQVPIDTHNPRASVSSMAAAAKVLRAGMPLFVFPEGGRTSDGGLRPFLPGAAYLAIRAQVPLVPIALSGVYELMPIHTHHYYPGELTVSIGEPIVTEGMTMHQVEELTARLREAIESLRHPPSA
ncbi:MAG: lysophospholipid acyltransferase family protein [Terracidiphilus sp.]|jgi:1-acyl-sn-glycerol-3-phosphate acyltransferase